MVFELDWLEREERYKQRLSRTLTVITIVILGVVGTGLYLMQRQEKATLAAEAEAAQNALLAEAARKRAEITADSTAAANRVAAFVEKYSAEPIEGAQLQKLPLPSRRGVGAYLSEAWSDFTHAVDPEVTPEDQRIWFRGYYIDVMNRAWQNSAGQIVWSEEHRPEALLMPEIRQRTKDPSILKPTFAQIVRAQEEVGIRVIEEDQLLPEGAEADSSLAQRTSESGTSESGTSESGSEEEGSEEPRESPPESP